MTTTPAPAHRFTSVNDHERLHALPRTAPFFAGGVLWVPAALTLLTAALLPGLAPGTAARRRRRMIYLGAMAGLVLVIAVTLVLLAL